MSLSDVHVHALAPSKRDKCMLDQWPQMTERVAESVQHLTDVFFSQLQLSVDELTLLMEYCFDKFITDDNDVVCKILCVDVSPSIYTTIFISLCYE